MRGARSFPRASHFYYTSIGIEFPNQSPNFFYAGIVFAFEILPTPSNSTLNVALSPD